MGDQPRQGRPVALKHLLEKGVHEEEDLTKRKRSDNGRFLEFRQLFKREYTIIILDWAGHDLAFRKYLGPKNFYRQISTLEAQLK